MTQPRVKKDKYRDEVRGLAVRDLQLLLGVEPHLANAFKALSKRAGSTELRTFCKEGVTYTLRREDRIKKSLKKLDAPLVSRPSAGLDGLIKDAKRAAARSKSAQTDVAILATIERISHFGLAAYTTNRSASSARWCSGSSTHTAPLNKGKARGHQRNEQNGATVPAPPPAEAMMNSLVTAYFIHPDSP